MNTSPRLPIILFLFVLAGAACHSGNGKKNVNNSGNIPGPDSLANTSAEIKPNPYSPVDISPMDMSYYPIDYPKLKMSDQQIPPPLARVVYSRPHLQGRHLFHEVLKYGEAWRLGANEATELQLFHDATIQGKKIRAGRYVLYCLPQPDQWMIVFNSNIDSWGLKSDSTKDIARFSVPVKKTDNHIEYYTMVFEKTDRGAQLVMAWDNLEARLPFNFL